MGSDVLHGHGGVQRHLHHGGEGILALLGGGILAGEDVVGNGADADIAVVDLNEDWIFDGTKSLSKTKTVNNLYHGSRMKGRVKETWVRGTRVFQDGRIEAAAGYGRYIPKNKQK